MVSIYNHIKSLEYESKPDYQMIESLMQEGTFMNIKNTTN